MRTLNDISNYDYVFKQLSKATALLLGFSGPVAWYYMIHAPISSFDASSGLDRAIIFGAGLFVVAFLWYSLFYWAHKAKDSLFGNILESGLATAFFVVMCLLASVFLSHLMIVPVFLLSAISRVKPSSVIRFSPGLVFISIFCGWLLLNGNYDGALFLAVSGLILWHKQNEPENLYAAPLKPKRLAPLKPKRLAASKKSCKDDIFEYVGEPSPFTGDIAMNEMDYYDM